jgi:quinol-cytochrome oxidoreductase complex cytochrome b subunit
MMSETTEKKPVETIPFFPDHLKTEAYVALGFAVIAIIIGVIAIFSPVGLEEPADPMVTPDHVKPEWYFLALYQLLKYIPKTLGVMIPIIGIIIVLIWPFLDKKEDTVKQQRIRAISSIVFMVVLIAMTFWGWYS